MSGAERRVLAEVERLLQAGRSLAITTIDSADASVAGRFDAADVLSEASGRCVQWVILPDGTRICVKYKG